MTGSGKCIFTNAHDDGVAWETKMTSRQKKQRLFLSYVLSITYAYCSSMSHPSHCRIGSSALDWSLERSRAERVRRGNIFSGLVGDRSRED